MLDIKLIRNNTDLVKDVISKRNMTLDVDAFLSIDKEKLELIQKIDELRELTKNFQIFLLMKKIKNYQKWKKFEKNWNH